MITGLLFLADPAIGGLYILDGESAGNVITVDVVFPVLHGTYGEDGTLQGLLSWPACLW